MTTMNLISLMEIYNLTINDNSNLYAIFNDIVLDDRLNKKVLIREIIKECGAMQPLFGTTRTFKMFSDGFFELHYQQIVKLTDTLYFEYNPIWNKDGTITETITRELNEDINRGIDTTNNKVVAETENGDNTDTGTINNNGTVETVTSAFNESTYQPNSKDITDTTETRNLTENHTNNRNTTDKTTENVDDITNRGEDETTATKRIEQGNIGVTSTQSLIQEERLLHEFNIYQWIVNKYRDELMLCVY